MYNRAYLCVGCISTVDAVTISESQSSNLEPLAINKPIINVGKHNSTSILLSTSTSTSTSTSASASACAATPEGEAGATSDSDVGVEMGYASRASNNVRILPYNTGRDKSHTER